MLSTHMKRASVYVPARNPADHWLAHDLAVRAGRVRVSNLTGVDDPYEVPRDPDLVVGEGGESPDVAACTVLAELVRRGWIHQAPWESA